MKMTVKLLTKIFRRSWVSSLPCLFLIYAHGTFAIADPAAQYATCASCHGANGEGNPALQAPTLAGQQAVYLEGQINQFRSGLRGTHADDTLGQLMKPLVDALDESTIAPLAQYITQLPGGEPLQPAVGDDIANGKKIFEGSCVACHGFSGTGNSYLKAPNLKILDKAYVSRQLNAYTNKWRGEDVEGNISAIWMRTISTHISNDQELADVMAYLYSME